MSTQTVQTNTEMHFSVVDKAGGPLARIAERIEKVSHRFDHLSVEVAKYATAGASLLGAFGMERLIEESGEHLAALRRITQVTGMAVSKADAFAEAFEVAGVPIQMTEHALVSLSRQGQRLQMAMDGVGRAMGAMTTSALLGGINLKDPEKAMIQIADRMHKGKLDATQLGLALRMDTSTALKLANLLKKGPEHLKEAIAEAKKFAVTSEQMTGYIKYFETKNELLAGLKRATILIGAELFPVLTKLLRYTADHVKEWVEKAKDFGQVLHKYLQSSLELALKLGKALALNAAVTKLTGSGIVSQAGRVLSFGQGKLGLLGLLTGAAPGSRAAGAVTAAAVAKPAYLLENIAERSPILRGMRALWSGARGGAASVAQGVAVARMVGPGAALGMAAGSAKDALGGGLVKAFQAAMPFVRGLLRLSGLGIIVAVLVAGMYAIFKNVAGVRDMLAETWEKIVTRFQTFMLALGPVGTFLEKTGGIIKDVFMLALPYVLNVLGEGVAALLGWFTRLALFIKGLTGGGWKHPMETWAKAGRDAVALEKQVAAQRQKQRLDAEIAARRAQARGAPDERGGTVMDFRNSRFDINQNFAEGFDPDRVAVAFTGGLATLGERKVQSAGFSPLFAVR